MQKTNIKKFQLLLITNKCYLKLKNNETTSNLVIYLNDTVMLIKNEKIYLLYIYVYRSFRA